MSEVERFLIDYGLISIYCIYEPMLLSKKNDTKLLL